VCLLFPCEYVAGRVSLRVQELCVEVETKTKEYARVALEMFVDASERCAVCVAMSLSS
jgi:hypothetical protein